MASEVCIRTHHLAPVWLSHLTICARTQLKGSGDKARDGGASHHLSALSGANALLSPVYWRLFTVIHQAITRLCGPYQMGRRKAWWREDACRQICRKSDLVRIHYFAHTSLFGSRLWRCRRGRGLSPSVACHSEDKHQLAAHSSDTNTSSRSQQITF